MPTNFKDPTITCDGCGATVERPAGALYSEGWRTLYEAGWRGRGNPGERPLRFAPHTSVWSCPGCHPVADY